MDTVDRGRPALTRRRMLRPVQARTVATRKRLVETAAAVLLERGHAGLSTNEVATRAGMARGTMLHHFPSRAALVAAAVEHLLEQRTEAVFAQLATIDAAMSLREVLHAVWPAFQDSTFAMWAQLCVAAGTDRELAEQLVAVDRRFTESTRVGFAGIAQKFGAVDPAAADLVRDFFVALLVGLGFERMLPRERRDIDDYFGPAAEIAMAMLNAGQRGVDT
jgi:AcrR family transcriptional regulator